ncbi:MAG: carbon-nitrogen hydrolase family protein [Cohaesibacter sp.]|nr:carbon-nitrogen hydrolase family protein [Cohaesibacter sp.]
MKNILRVTVTQLNNNPSKLEQDVKHLAHHINDHKPDFVLLPEMPFYPWLAASKDANERDWQLAINAHQTGIDAFAKISKTPFLSTRPTLNAAGSRRNQAFLWQEQTGAADFHDKRYLPNEEGYWEASWYDMGEDKFDIARLGNWRIGVQICTEMWFYEKSRQYGQQGVDLLCVPRATPHGSVKKWLAGGQAGAVVSGAYHLSSNSFTDKGEKADIGGLSWIISPEGDILATTDPDNPFATIDIDLNVSHMAKSTYPRYVKT